MDSASADNSRFGLSLRYARAAMRHRRHFVQPAENSDPGQDFGDLR
jgi:hypothetical protein